MGTKSTKPGWTDSAPKLLGVSLLVVLLAGGAITWWSNRRGATAERAFVLPGGRAILILRPTSMFGADHLARTVEVDVATGRAVRIVDDEGSYGLSLEVYSPAGGSLWYRASPIALWSRPLDAIDTRVDHATGAHPELGAGLDPRWLTPEGLVVRGRAANEYLVRPDGRIEPTEWVTNAIRYADWRAGDERHVHHAASARLAGGHEVRGEALPLERGGLVVTIDGAPLLVANGTAALALGGDLRVAVGLPQVDRVGAIAADRVLWSASTLELFGEPEHWDMWGEHLGVRVLAIGVEGDAATLVLRAQDEDGSTELRFVVLDGASGAVRSRVGLAPLE